ncbi:hypothetical protein KVT40_006610 [Elsinoe batatas]|uniref:Xaa-Pro dipeptidyl-peptidase C-terminal domain-containing protein n=1 Tax=Elsinoe batatas TaxID=2601811 RepID=A0A8K0KY93_9PEZI|nr:hypothetical protein KVT40_006610 [Elsinoe batatas]
MAVTTTDSTSFPYIFIKNEEIPLKTFEKGVLRANVYLPKDAVPHGSQRYPVIATYGPYGKDVPYSSFYKNSWDQLNPDMKSDHSAWETPDPGFWTRQGYIVLRVDERGAGQSPGELDTMSRGTSEAFFDVIEWAAEQPWSTGKVGLLGISYYAGTQWRVAARRPKGLAAIIPWEGMSDYYRDRVRHGGILSDKFIDFWWKNGVAPNQYGKPGRAARKWGEDTIEGDLDEKALERNRSDQTADTATHKFRDEEYYRTREFAIEDIEVPLLSVANWGGILLHLRGNVVGWMRAKSQHKFLHFIVGRHDLPFYYAHSSDGWKSGQQPRVKLTVREGDCGVDDPERELGFPSRSEVDWPLPNTRYTRFHLSANNTLTTDETTAEDGVKAYDALNSEPIQWTYRATERLEIIGHIVASGKAPSDVDLFVTLRKLDSDGKEIHFTGTMGDPVPIVKGWQRASLRKVDSASPLHREWLPYRNYYATDGEPLEPGVVYPIEVEIWPTNVVLKPGETLVFEVAGHDTQGVYHRERHDRWPISFTPRSLHYSQPAAQLVAAPTGCP